MHAGVQRSQFAVSCVFVVPSRQPEAMTSAKNAPPILKSAPGPADFGSCFPAAARANMRKLLMIRLLARHLYWLWYGWATGQWCDVVQRQN